MEITAAIIEKARSFGASLAGITTVSSLLESPSYHTCGPVPYPDTAASVLVLGRAHDRTEPELDWWDGGMGGTPGNRILIDIVRSLTAWVKESYSIVAHPLPYHVEKGGIFLKDAAALAGLGIIGLNNLLITAEYGPRLRLRAMFLDAELPPTGPSGFSPCEDCEMPCLQACPQEAFSTRTYSRSGCRKQMEKDEAEGRVIEKKAHADAPGACVKYCRLCELTCPVGV